MASRVLVKINPIVGGSPTSWHDVPVGYGYKMTSTTLVSSSRNSEGYVIGTVVREGIRKIELTWKYLTVSQFSSLAQLFEGSRTGGNGSFEFYVDYFDTIVGNFVNSQNDNHFKDKNNQNVARKFYVGDRVTDTAKIKLDESTGAPIGYTDVKLSLIEE